MVRVRRDLLEANGFLPDCSPFSERWMSELDNTRSKQELGMSTRHYASIWRRSSPIMPKTRRPRPASYRRRRAELLLLEQGDPVAK